MYTTCDSVTQINLFDDVRVARNDADHCLRYSLKIPDDKYER